MLNYTVATLLLLLLVTTSGFNLLPRRPASSASIVGHASLPRYASTVETHQAGVAAQPAKHGTPYGEASSNIPRISRRNLVRGVFWGSGAYCVNRSIGCAWASYTVNQVEPNETETYAEAQKGNGPLRVLWVGSGNMKGVSKDLFLAGNEVIAVDLRRPAALELRAATRYATEHGYRLRFEKGDATDLKFGDGTFDVVVCSMFLCQDFDPEVVVSQIRRVLKPGGRFGFYEHVEDIGDVIVDKVFGERSVVRVQAYPEITNVVAGIVRKV